MTASPIRLRWLLAAWTVIASCAPSGRPSAGNRCLSIAQEYAVAIQDALVCDPADPSTCSAGRPLMVSRQEADGSTTLEGLCAPPCLGAVNPARTAAADEVLARFEAEGCAFAYCPCPPPEWLPAKCLASGTCAGIATSW